MSTPKADAATPATFPGSNATVPRGQLLCQSGPHRLWPDSRHSALCLRCGRQVRYPKGPVLERAPRGQ